jgi:hypothetical protein
MPEYLLKKIHRIHVLKITFDLDVDKVSMQTKTGIFELQILTHWDKFFDVNVR